MDDYKYTIENRYNRSIIGLMEQCNNGEWCKTHEASRKLYMSKVIVRQLESNIDSLHGKIENYIKLSSFLAVTTGVSTLLLIISLIKMYVS